MLAGVICQPAVCRIGQYLLLYIFFKTKDVSVIRYLCGFLHLAELPFFPYCNGILTSPHKMFCVLSPIASVCSIKILMHKALHSISQWKLVNDSVTIPFLLWWKAKIFWLRARPVGSVWSMLGWDWVLGSGSSCQMWTWKLAGLRNGSCRWRQHLCPPLRFFAYNPIRRGLGVAQITDFSCM